MLLINPLQFFSSIEDHVALDRNSGLEYDTLLLWLIPGDFYSVSPNKQFCILPSLLYSRAALLNFYHN